MVATLGDNVIKLPMIHRPQLEQNDSYGNNSTRKQTNARIIVGGTRCFELLNL
jgi:hypothetical protein